MNAGAEVEIISLVSKNAPPKTDAENLLLQVMDVSSSISETSWPNDDYAAQLGEDDLLSLDLEARDLAFQ